MKNRAPLMVINQLTTSTCADAVDVMSSDNFAEALEAHVNVSNVRVMKPRATAQIDRVPPKQRGDKTEIRVDKNDRVLSQVDKFGNIQSTRGKSVDAETLARRWGIDHKKALNTVRMTTQRGVRTCLYPSMSRRFPTNDRMLRYKRLPHPVFTDTMFA